MHDGSGGGRLRVLITWFANIVDETEATIWDFGVFGCIRLGKGGDDLSVISARTSFDSSHDALWLMSRLGKRLAWAQMRKRFGGKVAFLGTGYVHTKITKLVCVMRKPANINQISLSFVLRSRHS